VVRPSSPMSKGGKPHALTQGEGMVRGGGGGQRNWKREWLPPLKVAQGKEEGFKRVGETDHTSGKATVDSSNRNWKDIGFMWEIGI